MPAYEVFEVGAGHLDAWEADARRRARQDPASRRDAGAGADLHPDLVDGVQRHRAAAEHVGPGAVPGHDRPAQPPHVHRHRRAPGAIYTEIDWASVTDLLYLRLYDPSCQVAGESAGLLDIGAVNHRALLVTSPAAGTWTVAVYGRINLPTDYTGSFETYVKN